MTNAATISTITKLATKLAERELATRAAKSQPQVYEALDVALAYLSDAALADPRLNALVAAVSAVTRAHQSPNR